MKNTCIIIDDMESHRLLLSQVVEICGLEVLAVGNDGKEAISLFEKLRPDIVFSDIRMPVFDGFHAITGIKEMDNSTKIIAVTADNTLLTMQKLSDLRIPVIVKPYSIDVIKKFLKELL